jgi:hypothetical protein
VKCRLLPHGQSKRRRDTPGRSVTYITRPSTLRLPVAPIVLGTRRLCARCCGTAIWSDSLALGRGARVCQGVRARVSARAGSHASSDSRAGGVHPMFLRRLLRRRCSSSTWRCCCSWWWSVQRPPSLFSTFVDEGEAPGGKRAAEGSGWCNSGGAWGRPRSVLIAMNGGRASVTLSSSDGPFLPRLRLSRRCGRTG